MQWQSPKIFPILSSNQIHVWRTSLTRTEKELVELRELLSYEERTRAAKFINQRAANSFIVARSILRKLLSCYLQINSHDLIFRQNRYGKLYLDSSPLQFNLSHSHSLALFIFALNTPVGIDVEFIRNDYEFTDIVRKFFSETESKALFSLPEDTQRQAFFNCWTLKEAFIKAKGIGMFYALDKFSVEVISNKEGKMMLNNWTLQVIDPAKTYAGAFAVDALEFLANFYQI